MRFNLFIKETCLYVSDIKTSREFYHQLLGLPIHSQSPSHVFFHAGPSMLLCFLGEVSRKQQNLPEHYAEGHIHFAFEAPISEYELMKEYLILNGIKVEHEQQWKNGLKSFYFRDPDKHLLEVLQPGIWQSSATAP